MSEGQKIQVLSQSWFLAGCSGLLKLTGQRWLKPELAPLVSSQIFSLLSSHIALLLHCTHFLDDYKNEWADFMDAVIDKDYFL